MNLGMPSASGELNGAAKQVSSEQATLLCQEAHVPPVLKAAAGQEAAAAKGGEGS